MPAPFGFGVGDFVAVGTLAWAVYKSSKSAPESFRNIHVEVLSLHALTREAEETVFKSPLTPERQARLGVVKDGCMSVLTDLDKLVKKYESLGTSSKRTWDRMRWANEDISEIRARLNTNVTLLAAFISTSQATVEEKLDKFLLEFKQGKREGSVISVQTIDSLTRDEKVVWRTIRKELEDAGISLAAWESNHDFILKWFIHMIETGAFEEEGEEEDDDDGDSPSSGDGHGAKSPTSDQPPNVAISENQAPTTELSTEDLAAMDEASQGQHTISSAEITARGKRPIEGSLARGMVSVALRALARPQTRLLDAASFEYKSSVVAKILAKYQFDEVVLGSALMKASGANAVASMRLLAENGADLQYRSTDSTTPLSTAVHSGSEAAVDYLLLQGVDVNFCTREIRPVLHVAAAENFVPIMKRLVSAGAMLNFKRWDHDAQRVFSQAVKLSRLEAVRILLKAGAKLDSYAFYLRSTPLMDALSIGSVPMARLLIENGADVLQASQWSLKSKTLTPLQYAIFQHEPSLVMLLLDHNAMPTLEEARPTVGFFNKLEDGSIGFYQSVNHTEEYKAIKVHIQDQIEKLSPGGSRGAHPVWDPVRNRRVETNDA